MEIYAETRERERGSGAELDPTAGVAELKGLSHRVIRPLERAFEVAADLGCRTVVIENRYVDADYSSEYSAFWSQRFTDPPSFARRLHFFATEISADEIHCVDPETCEYLGYVILRPVPHAPVGRALLRPPPALIAAKAVLTEVDDNVSFFGTSLPVRGVPFSQQDGEYVRCAHAALWTCQYIIYRQRLIGRYTTADVIELSPTTLDLQRALPSKGMNVPQMQTVLSEMGLPPLTYLVGDLPTVLGIEDPAPPPSPQNGDMLPAGRWDSRFVTIACRYLNSRLPVIVSAGTHTFLLVGYYFDSDGQSDADQPKRIRFVVCDDQTGPYDLVVDPLSDDDHGGPWDVLMVPQPPKVFLTAEAAETSAYYMLSQPVPGPAPLSKAISDKLGAGVRLRTFLMRGREYKSRLSAQDRFADVVRTLRLTPLSHYVIVVEAHDYGLRTESDRYVVAEFVYDATSYDLEPRALCVSYPEFTYVDPPDYADRRYANTGDQTAWRSQLDPDFAHDRVGEYGGAAVQTGIRARHR